MSIHHPSKTDLTIIFSNFYRTDTAFFSILFFISQRTSPSSGESRNIVVVVYVRTYFTQGHLVLDTTCFRIRRGDKQRCEDERGRRGRGRNRCVLRRGRLVDLVLSSTKPSHDRRLITALLCRTPTSVDHTVGQGGMNAVVRIMGSKSEV